MNSWAALVIPIVVAILIAAVTVFVSVAPEEAVAKLGKWAIFTREKFIKAWQYLRGSFVPRHNASGALKQLGKRFDSLSECVPMIFEILGGFSTDARTREAKLFVPTMGSTIPIIREYIETRRRRRKDLPNMNFRVLVIDPNSEAAAKCAPHWAKEARLTMETLLPELNHRFKNLERKFRFEWQTYDIVPCVHGYLFDNTHLFIGWFEWVDVHGRKQLEGTKIVHLYFERGSPGADFFFSLFNNWFDYLWTKE